MSTEVTFPITLPVVKDGNGNVTGAQLSEEVAKELCEYCYESNKDKLYEYCKERVRQEAQKQAQARQGPPQTQTQGAQGTDLLNTVTRVIEKILPLKLTLGILNDLFAPPVDGLTAIFTGLVQLVPVIFVTIAFVRIIEGLAV